MNEEVVESFEQFHLLIASLPTGSFFRGVADCDNFALIPSIGRFWKTFSENGYSREEFFKQERDVLQIFSAESAAVLGARPRSRWESIIVAQHHGLPTRLLDWSMNPLVGLYFAVIPGFECDGALYVMKPEATMTLGHPDADGDPQKIDRVMGIAPPHISPRIRAQAGAFTTQPDPTIELQHPSLRRIRIATAARQSIARVLFRYGVNAKMLFPDLDGLAKWVVQLKLAPI